MVWGIPAHLLYVSSNQIDLQLPSEGTVSTQDVVVSTAAGSSQLSPLGGTRTFGIFSDDASGCGQGAVLNASSSGKTSLNSMSNSASPGDFISVYGTGLGLVYHAPADGYPAPSTPPLAVSPGGVGGFLFDLDVAPTNFSGYWAGRAPGFVGLDQINIAVPDDVREGCAVPLQFASDSLSQPVTMAIHNGGGHCVDPPSAGYGQVVWEKTIDHHPRRDWRRELDHGVGHPHRIPAGFTRQASSCRANLYPWCRGSAPELISRPPAQYLAIEASMRGRSACKPPALRPLGQPWRRCPGRSKAR